MTTASKPETREMSRSLQTPDQSSAGGQGWKRALGRRLLRRWPWAVATAVVLGGLVWFLPMIVAHSPVLNWIIAAAAADLNGEVTVRSASLGWFSAPALEGIEVRDEQGELLLEIPKLQCDRSLLAILRDRSDLGHVRLENPKITAVLRHDGSNVEDVLASYLAPREKPPAKVGVALEIVDGSVAIREPQAQQTWQIEDLQLTLDLPADQTEPLRLQTSGILADATQPGEFSAELNMQRGGRDNSASAATSEDAPPSDEPAPASSDELTVKTESLTLAILKPALNRLRLDARLAGRLSSSLQCRWNGPGGPAGASVQGFATVEDLALAAPPLGADRVELSRVHTVCRAAWQDGQLRVDELSTESDVGNLSLLGTLDLRDKPTGKMLVWLPEQTVEINGRIDLARLAAILPNTLRIRQGTQITSGQVQLNVASRRGAEGMSWQGRIATSNLTAVDRGRRLVWEQPIRLTLDARETPKGPIVENLECESDFLRIHAAGTRNNLTASANFDLNRLMGQLGSFIDLGGVHLAGDGWAEFKWRQSQQRGFEADGQLRVRGFELALPNRPRWTEENLVAVLSATGRTDFAADTQVDRAALTLDAGPDRLEARLVQPVLDMRGGGVWPLEVRSNGELARWQPRISPWVNTEGWNFAGTYHLLGQVIGSATAIHVRRTGLTAQQLQVRGPGVHVREPQAELVASGAWSRDRQRLELPSATFTSGTLSAQATNVVCTLPEGDTPQLTGTVTYHGNLQPLQRWTAHTDEPPQWRFLGAFSGKAEIRHSAGVTSGTFETTVNDLVATHRSGRQLHEPQVRLVGRGTYDAASRSVRLQRAQLASGTLGVQAAGRIALEDQPHAQLAGQIDYDLDKISELLGPHTGNGVRLAGRGSSPASYNGPLRLDAAQAETTAGWKWAEVYGFQVGPGQTRATLSGGVLRLDPLDLDVSEGRLRLASQLRLAPEPMQLHVEPGRLVEQVRINPKMCQQGLQYIAPVLAGVAAAEGRFSIELDACRIPWSNPDQGELAGRMTVHSVQIGPGPLIRELALLLGRASPAQLARESVISFQLDDGRIHHQGLELVFPNVTIRTYGSVGLDQSLAITAEMPIPPMWRTGRSLLDSALKDQIIRVPIGGTLRQPKIDRTALQQLSRQFLEKAARNALEDGLNKGLERLLNPRQ